MLNVSADQQENHLCSKKFDQSMMTCLTLYFLCYLMGILTRSRPEENFVTGLMFMSVLLFILGIWINSVLALVYGLKMVLETDGWKCKPAWQLSIDAFFLAVGIFTLLFVAGVAIFFSCKTYLRKRREEKARQEVITLFETIYDPNKDVEKLLHKYKDILEEMELTDPELTIFYDAFTKHWEKDQNGLDDAQAVNCIICYMAFGLGDKVLEFPGCKHQYHVDCLQEWILKSPRCPMCKAHMRISMIRALKIKGQN